MAKILDTFITKFRFDEDRQGLQKVSKGIAGLKSQLLGVGAALAAAFLGATFIGSTERAVDEQAKFARSIGISVEQLQELDFASERVGVSTDTLHASLFNMQTIVGQVARGYGMYGAALARYGVNVRDANGKTLNAFQLMTQLNKVFQKLDRPEQLDLARNLGLTPSVLKILQQTPKAFEALVVQSRKLGQFTEKDAKASEKFEDKITDLKTAFFELKVTLGTALLPVLDTVIVTFTDAFERVRTLEERFPRLTRSITIVAGAFGGLAVALKIIPFLLGAIVTLGEVIASPFILIGTAIAAVLLVLQDLWVGFRGGKSAIVPFIDRMADALKKTKAFKAVIKELGTLFKPLADKLQFLNKGLSALSKGFSKVFNFAAKEDRKASIAFSAGVHKVFSRSAPVSTAVRPSVAPSATKQAVNVNVGGVTVNATTNAAPADIAAAVHSTLRDQLKTSTEYLDSSVAR